MFRRIAVRVSIVAALSLACSDSTGPDSAGTDELMFLQLAPDAPPLVSSTASFWARTDRDSDIRMYFRPRPSQADSSEFLRFRLDERSLSRKPGGAPFSTVDSILITITVTDLQRLIVDFQPSGLRFAADRPARLEIEYDNTDHDFDDDGDVDGDDDELEERFSIWRQETTGGPWVELGTARRKDIDEVEAELLGFSNHAIAYRKPRR